MKTITITKDQDGSMNLATLHDGKVYFYCMSPIDQGEKVFQREIEAGVRWLKESETARKMHVGARVMHRGVQRTVMRVRRPSKMLTLDSGDQVHATKVKGAWLP